MPRLRLSKALLILAVAATAMAGVSCDHVDNKRLPVVPVNLMFWTQADWDTYGVTGAGQYRIFNKEKRTPTGFNYLASSYTGFGGVLLCSTFLGEPVAYDAACPVECRADVVVFINDNYEAECPRCHSRYDVFSLLGGCISGEAAEKGYGLQVYTVSHGRNGEYMVIYN